VSRRRVAVLFGGRSAEHEISCISARAVIDALDARRTEVIPIGITREGRWHLLSGPPPLPSESGRMPEVTDGSGRPVELAGEGTSAALIVADGSRETVDIVFPVLHGPMGEDGAVQGLMELAGIPYVGAGVTASAVGMDKDVQRALFARAGLPLVPYEVVREPEWRDDPDGVASRAQALGYPLFSKPATLGSSVGVVKVHGPSELAEGVEEALRYSPKALIEWAVPRAREVECAVLGNDDPVASVVGEIVPTGHEFYDYEAKYLDVDGARLQIPADLPPEVSRRIQQMAVSAFRAIDCAGMARVDFFVEGDGDGPAGVWLNEINTIPGFTSISMYPKLWEASGLAYPDLIERLLDLAVERHEAMRGRSTGPRELSS
jgi:D-alanine-D-alanine ligase